MKFVSFKLTSARGSRSSAQPAVLARFIFVSVFCLSPTHSSRALTQNRAKSARDANDSSTNPLGPWAFFTVYRSCAISIQNFVQLVHSLPEWSSVEGSGRSGFAIATHLRFKRQQQQTTKKSTQKQGGKQSEKNRARGRGKSVEHEQSNTIVK